MSLRKFNALIPPPPHPSEQGDQDQWDALQTRLGTKLPEDWFEFGKKYGTGTLQDRDHLDIWILNPFSAKDEEKRSWMQSNLEAMRIEGSDYVPFPIFPEKKGLLALGDDVNGNELYWLTAGRPDKWKIVVRSRGDDSYEEFDGPLFAFLAGVFRGEIAVKVWPEPFFSDRKRLSFQPTEITPVQVDFPKTLYVLYVQNGNRAGFWVRHIAGREGVLYFVKTVDGKSEGSLSGIPEEYDHQPVVVDMHWGGKLFEADMQLGSAHRPNFHRSEPPNE